MIIATVNEPVSKPLKPYEPIRWTRGGEKLAKGPACDLEFKVDFWINENEMYNVQYFFLTILQYLQLVWQV